ncbi:DUF4349 domain-containing protein [Orrella marina]|uniref:DUF4349 domain-containing protein n=1 Tax=Orrella marina TaxID=2163011 RepID=A0A2R4XHF4_9BURK|nr:DUF4349 domain-containing protein [Orrella marina]AWB33174.1 hypothetical protein DBV39_05010 [Orrella marina]
MQRKLISLAVLTLTLGLGGCYDSYDEQTAEQGVYNSQDASIASDPISDRSTASLMRAAPVANADAGGQAADMEATRKIAESQQWVFETRSDVLESVWQAHRDICLKLGQECEIVQASISSRGPGEGANYGNIEMRVDHTAFDHFLSSMQSAGPAPIETSITREDRTLEWVDLQSRLDNAKNLRDRLQAMIRQADQEHKLSDLLAIERELNRVQSTIDSMQSQSRVMARQTDKVRMNFTYRSAPQTVSRDIWDPIRHAWHNMTGTFSRSVGDVMLFVAGTIPWLVVLIPGWIFGRWALPKVFARWLKRPVSR